MVKQAVTIKIKLKKRNIPEFDELTQRFAGACNYISQYVFDYEFELNEFKLHKILYYLIREKFHLKAELTVSSLRCVVARYKATRTLLEERPWQYYDKTTKKTYKINRDLSWLKRPLHFKPQADLYRDRDWSFIGNQLSLATLTGRIKLDYICKGFDQYKNWHFGAGKLVKRGNSWYFYISLSKELSDYDLKQTKHIVGIDRGERFIMVCYDETGKTLFYSGKQIIRKHNKYKELRRQLQKRDTKSAKRRLKKIGHRENRWMSDVNHCLSKTLVNLYGPNTLFVLEDLKGIAETTVKHRKKKNRYAHGSWSYFQLEQDLTYKANLNNSKVVKVNPQYTSQRCPKCGRIKKGNRNHDLHLYTCDNCGYRSNDDRIAGMNIQELGIEYLHGNKKPKFTKNKSKTNNTPTHLEH